MSFAQTRASLSLSSSYDLVSEAALDGEAYELQSPRLQSGEGTSGPSRIMRGGSDAGPSRRSSFDSQDDDDDDDDVIQFTPEEDRAVRNKFDRKLVLFVALLFMLSFVDRSNIGNARIAGMEEDLQTDPPRDDWYELCLSVFYVSYILFEGISVLFKVVPAHILVSCVVMAWGLTASLQAIATSYPMLVAMRFVLGIGEAGFTGIPFYLSFFFKREELAFRTAIFISAAPLATTFASTLAWGILQVAHLTPIAPWRLLFLIEGFPTVIAAVAAWSVIPDSPQTASYLTPRERQVARLRVGRDSSSSPASGFKLADLTPLLRDPVPWLIASMFFLTNMAYSSLPVFLPKIISEMGHSAVTSQALSAPPYLLSFVVVLFTAHMSDRWRVRTVPLVFHAIASATGYAILALAEPLKLPPFLRYMAIYPAAVGFFNVVTLTVAWNINNQRSEARQGGAFAIMQFIGQCGPLVGTRLYPDRDAPYYSHGMQTCAGAMFSVAVLALILRFYMGRQNAKMDAEEERGIHESILGEEEEGFFGSRKKESESSFRYML